MIVIVVYYNHSQQSDVELGEKEGKQMLATFKRLLADKSGVTAIEYGLICALISIILIIVFSVGTSLVTSLELLIPALR